MSPIKATVSKRPGLKIALNKQDVRCCLNAAKLMLGCLSADGRLFHIFGTEFEKLLSLNRVFVRGTTQVLVSAERR